MGNEDLGENHPLRIFENSPHGGLPESELSVFLARAGVGKSSAIINFGLHALRQGQHVLHFSVGRSAERVHQFYQEIDFDFVHHYHQEGKAQPWSQLSHNLMVISYHDPVKMINDLEDEIGTIINSAKIKPSLVLVSRIDFDDKAEDGLAKLSHAAKKHEIRILGCMTVHREPSSGAVALEEPVKLAQKHARRIYFLDPEKGRIKLESIIDGQQHALPIHFNPTELIFCNN